MLKAICLGTAMWGWSVHKEEAFKILDLFYRTGGRYIDTAFNYPIDGNLSHLSLAACYLKEWIELNDISDLKIIYKVGSIVNTNVSDNDLSNDRLNNLSRDLFNKFGTNLYCLMIHWDNRDCFESIYETLRVVNSNVNSVNVRIGLSGIKFPSKYNEMLMKLDIEAVDIEVKSNFLSRGEVTYQAIQLSGKRLWAYGISGSGLKLSESEYRADSYVSLTRNTDYHKKSLSVEWVNKITAAIKNINYIKNIYNYSIIYAELNKSLYGYIVSPSSLTQMQDILKIRDHYKKSILIGDVSAIYPYFL